MTSDRRLIGVDFSSSPSAKKPIIAAFGELDDGVLHVQGFEAFDSLPRFECLLARPGPWLGAFDMPFGLPREFVLAQAWPIDWSSCMDAYASLSRAELRDRFKAFCDARPVGGKFAHRATDGPAGASPSMKWVNPPVAWMMHAGVPCLRAAGVTIPGLSAGDLSRIAIEAYPGLLARTVTRASYKSDDAKRATHAREAARADILGTLLARLAACDERIEMTPRLQQACIKDPRGDYLDAVLCLVIAAWSARRATVNYGCPVNADPLEGWIAMADDERVLGCLRGR